MKLFCSADAVCTLTILAIVTLTRGVMAADSLSSQLCVPAGTKISISMNADFSSSKSVTRSLFSASTINEVSCDGKTAIPIGAQIDGTIVVSMPDLSGTRTVTMLFDTISIPNLDRLAIATDLVPHGGVVHIKRGLKDIAIPADYELPTLTDCLGNTGGPAHASGQQRASHKALNSGQMTKQPSTDANDRDKVRLIARKNLPVNMMKGDEIKIQLMQDLVVPQLSKTSEAQ